jgi:hypothetical protein
MKITSDSVIVCDPGYIFPYKDTSPYVDIPENCPIFNDFGGDGSFKAYQCEEYVIIDTAPKLFKPGKRSILNVLPGEVSVDAGMIAFFDATPTNRELIDSKMTNQMYIEFKVPSGDYVTWEEEHDTSESHRRMIIGFGQKPLILMAGENANTIEQLEKAIAKTLRMKGPDKNKNMEEIKENILDLHWAGNKDQRLKMLAQAVRLKLPVRRGKQKS